MQIVYYASFDTSDTSTYTTRVLSSSVLGRFPVLNMSEFAEQRVAHLSEPLSKHVAGTIPMQFFFFRRL